MSGRTVLYSSYSSVLVDATDATDATGVVITTMPSRLVLISTRCELACELACELHRGIRTRGRGDLDSA